MGKRAIGLGLVLLVVLVLLAVPKESPAMPVVDQKALLPLTRPAVPATETAAPEQTRVAPLPSPTWPPPTAGPFPTTSPPVTPAPTKKVKENFFRKMMAPFAEMVNERRQSNPNFAQCADPSLNAGRVNFVAFGYGETFEPSEENRNPPPIVIGSPRLFSWNLNNNTLAEISLTHDIRCPECEEAWAKALGWPRQKIPVMRLDHAYLHPQVGNFALLQKVMACATGLWPDYQIAFADDFLVDLVDNVFEGIWVDIPHTLEVQPFYLGGKKFDEKRLRRFEKGPRLFNGLTVLAYIKTVPIPPPGKSSYPPEWEHQVRGDTFFAALRKTTENRVTDKEFWVKFLTVLTLNKVQGRLDADFDLTLTLRHGDRLLAQLVEIKRQGEEVEPGLPTISQEIYIVDKCCSRDPNLRAVHWVDPNVKDDAWMQKDFTSGYYALNISGVEVPYNGNPYSSDLAHDYWASVREAVKKALTEAGDKKIPPAE